MAGEGKTEKEVKGTGLVQGVSSSGQAALAWVGRAKVAPEQVLCEIFQIKSHSSHQDLTERQNKSTGSTENSNKVNKEDSEVRGLQREGVIEHLLAGKAP